MIPILITLGKIALKGALTALAIALLDALAE